MNGGDMKNYVIVTGAAFLLMTLIHVWRFIVQRSAGSDPFFVTITVISATLAAWAARLVWRTSHP